jgi:hypothetical protein
MTRRALIIGAPGPLQTPRYLAGVGIDFQNYKQFLLSASGGAWEEGEISQLIEPTRQGLLTRLQRMQADYTLLVFTGHGGTGQNNGLPFVEINSLGEYASVNELRTGADRQLVVLDSCRTFVAGLSGLMTEGLQHFPSSLQAAQARQLYDDQLARCEAGRVVCFSCKAGTASADTPEGGLFSNTLFTTTQQWVDSSGTFDTLPVLHAIRQCQQALVATGQPQVPSLWSSPSTRQQWFPWAVRLPLGVL